MNFKIYFGILPSNNITNCIAPGYRHVTGDKTLEGEQKRAEATTSYVNFLNQKKNKFYIKLEGSIKKEGIINPILVQAGYCTESYRKYLSIEHQQDLSKCLCCDRNGGSRLWIAQKLNIDVPCIIADYSNMFKDRNYEELTSVEEILNKYKVRPKNIIINEHGVHVREPVHIHLGNK
jgi:hypothetical protein